MGDRFAGFYRFIECFLQAADYIFKDAVNFMADQRLVRAHFYGEVAKRTPAELFVLFVKLAILLIDQVKEPRNPIQRGAFW